MRSATFRNVALGILSLAAAYHLGARGAVAQAPGNAVVGITHRGSGAVVTAVTSNGDAYSQDFRGNPFVYDGNIFGAATLATPTTLGTVKRAYR